ncbi:MAG TPA: silent information regulator protein Sir2 [Phycisphaerae bacterium]|nr:silent information regulator protein Sir2 [Phycisphaerae bacterium]HRY67133.1 silent information regulator protein Sir2 [Phycisphaerae bacterium]HSA26498.1 silent information regulator protein Sir2 [Phycisphaerae bacterium]
MWRSLLVGVLGVLLSTAGAGGQLAEKLDRGVVALRNPDGSIYIGWRLLASDPKDAAFHVFRAATERAELRQVTTEPIRDRTSFLDQSAATSPGSDAPVYAVHLASPGAQDQPSSPVPVANPKPGLPYVSIKLQSDYTAQKVAVADLDGDGRYDYVIKQPNFNVDPYEKPGYWKKSQDTYKLEAYRGDGKFLWRHDMGWSIEEGIWYSPYVVYDLDGDGMAEVYAKAGEGDPRDADGRVQSGPEWVVKLNGLTGKVEQKLDWPDRSGFERYNYYCRNLLGVAYLDGKRPHLIVQRGTYTQIKVEAYDPQLKLVWRWNSKDEKTRYNGQGMHGMHAADVDGDGRDEIILGSAVLDDNGHGLWTRGVGHPDACYVGDIDPARPGLEVFCGIEPSQKRDAVCLVDARTGDKLWGCAEPSKHVHSSGMVADIVARYPGQECYAGERDVKTYWLFTADGKRIGDKEIGGLAPRAAWWDADPQKELVLGQRIRQYEGTAYQAVEGSVTTIADCLGDWREEIITALPGEIRIHSTMIPSTIRRLCLMQDRLYRLDVTMASMGYFYPPQLSGPLLASK